MHDQHLLVWFNRWSERVKRRWLTQSSAGSDCVQNLCRFWKFGTLLLLGTQYLGLSLGVGVSSPTDSQARHCSNSPLRGWVKCRGDISHPWGCDNQWAFNLDAHQPWSYMESLLVSPRAGWGVGGFSLAVSQHFQHGHNRTALKEIRRKDPQQQNKQGSQTVSPYSQNKKLKQNKSKQRVFLPASERKECSQGGWSPPKRCVTIIGWADKKKKQPSLCWFNTMHEASVRYVLFIFIKLKPFC